MTFHNIWECHHPNWRTHIFQRGWNHQSKTCLEISVVQGSEIFQPMIVGQSWELVQLMVVFDASHCQHVETGQRISCSLKLLKNQNRDSQRLEFVLWSDTGRAFVTINLQLIDYGVPKIAIIPSLNGIHAELTKKTRCYCMYPGLTFWLVIRDEWSRIGHKILDKYG